MDQNKIPPDFERIGATCNTLGTEIPRIRNIDSAQQSQQRTYLIQQLQDEVRRDITEIWQSQRSLDLRLTVVETTTIQCRNKDIFQADLSGHIFPLRDPATLEIIPNYPSTADQINNLNSAEGTRILQALQVPIPPRRVEGKRRVGRRGFL
ncbi:hypothetical protein K449DRAFT_435532 [Hypoxylon sp. EC38]|nr:hypothetical protein K449DRAFT_435532 [Hypoxylon sp. EC38]